MVANKWDFFKKNFSASLNPSRITNQSNPIRSLYNFPNCIIPYNFFFWLGFCWSEHNDHSHLRCSNQVEVEIFPDGCIAGCATNTKNIQEAFALTRDRFVHNGLAYLRSPQRLKLHPNKKHLHFQPQFTNQNLATLIFPNEVRFITAQFKFESSNHNQWQRSWLSMAMLSGSRIYKITPFDVWFCAWLDFYFVTRAKGFEVSYPQIEVVTGWNKS